MDGKVLVICCEPQNVNEFGIFVDTEAPGGMLPELRKVDDNYINFNGEKVDIDEHKKIMNAMDLLLPVQNEFLLRNEIFFVNWENIIPSDIKDLAKLKAYALSSESLPMELFFKDYKDQSLMRKAYLDRIQSVERPSFDYGFMAIDDFMQLFTRMLDSNEIVSVIPAFSNKDDEETIRARTMALNSWKDTCDIRKKANKEPLIEMLPYSTYSDFDELYKKAQEELMKIYNKPYSFEGQNPEAER